MKMKLKTIIDNYNDYSLVRLMSCAEDMGSDVIGGKDQLPKWFIKETKSIEMVNRIGEILSEASIFDSKYEEGSKFLALSGIKQLLNKGLPTGAKTPNGPFTKKAPQKKFIEVSIGKGHTVFVYADDTKKLYKITASSNQFKSMFGKMRKGSNKGGINWNTDTYETAACFGLFVNGVSILEALNSTKSQDDLSKVIIGIRDKVNTAIARSGEYSAAGEIQSKLETMPLTDWYILAQLMAGMTQFTDKVPNFSSKYLINCLDKSLILSGITFDLE